MEQNKIIIAIDGYSSTGKSTIAKAIARKLNYIYVDTGAMYRAVTLYCMQNGLIDAAGNVSPKLADLCRKHLNGESSDKGEICIEFRKNGADVCTYLNGKNVEKEIRSIEVANSVSAVSAVPEVRELLVKQQQLMGSQKGVAMDGRDIGTVVFPSAELKIFMTASPEIRAMRRFNELLSKGENVNFDEVKRNIEERDYKDVHRLVSPLKQADDAVVLDNSNMSQEEQVEWLYEKVKKLCEQKI